MYVAMRKRLSSVEPLLLILPSILCTDDRQDQCDHTKQSMAGLHISKKYI